MTTLTNPQRDIVMLQSPPLYNKRECNKRSQQQSIFEKKCKTPLLVPGSQFFRDYLHQPGKVPINVRKLLILTNASEKKSRGKDTDLP